MAKIPAPGAGPAPTRSSADCTIRSRSLAAAHGTGVEPVGGMLAVLRRLSPATPAVAATAEALSLRDGSLDAITVAQAFHWFEALRALREFHRVLRPGGRLALLWNARDRSVDWVDRCWTIIDRVEKRAPWRDHDNWRETAFVQNAWFTALAETQLH